MLQTIVALFVKPPVPGMVKTRLAAAIGADEACRIYCTLAERAIQQIRQSDIPLALFFDGSDPGQMPEHWRTDALFWLPQQGDDLGKRMAAAFHQLFDIGIQQVVLVGSDIDGLDAAYLQQAVNLLDTHDLVLGPVFDGGYCLIGCTRSGFRNLLFEGINWSTDQVLRQTLEAADAAGLTSALLPYLRDIDLIADLKACNLQLTDP